MIFFHPEYLLIVFTLLMQNAFWTVQFSDPHRAITFDEMHANDHGLGGKHLFPQAKLFVSQLGAAACQKVDDQYVMPWLSGFG